VQKTPSPEYAIRWSFNGDVAAGADTRSGMRKELDLGGLASGVDLKA
jgi:hypothetical protein